MRSLCFGRCQRRRCQLLLFLMELKQRRQVAAAYINPRLQAGFRRKRAIKFVEHKRKVDTAATLQLQRVFRGHKARVWWAARLKLMIASAK